MGSPHIWAQSLFCPIPTFKWSCLPSNLSTSEVALTRPQGLPYTGEACRRAAEPELTKNPRYLTLRSAVRHDGRSEAHARGPSKLFWRSPAWFRRSANLSRRVLRHRRSFRYQFLVRSARVPLLTRAARRALSRPLPATHDSIDSSAALSIAAHHTTLSCMTESRSWCGAVAPSVSAGRRAMAPRTASTEEKAEERRVLLHALRKVLKSLGKPVVIPRLPDGKSRDELLPKYGVQAFSTRAPRGAAAGSTSDERSVSDVSLAAHVAAAVAARRRPPRRRCAAHVAAVCRRGGVAAGRSHRRCVAARARVLVAGGRAAATRVHARIARACAPSARHVVHARLVDSCSCRVSLFSRFSHCPLRCI